MVKSYKPNPEIFARALSELGCCSQEALVIGDSPLSDILGARNAGIKMVWLNRTNQVLSAEYPSPDFQIQNLTQLIPVLNQLT
jgi:putative hydrolase of the HAD superfamily